MNVDEHVDPSINDMIRELQPNAVINNRGYDEGDFGTPERDYNPELDAELGFGRMTEACQSIGKEIQLRHLLQIRLGEFACGFLETLANRCLDLDVVRIA